MKNPLTKRILREFRSDLGKYAVIFLFMVIMIGLVSGDLVASGSMIRTYNENYTAYNVENGHFELEREATDKLFDNLSDSNVTIYPDFYVERNYTGEDGARKTLRIYHGRQAVNKPCLMSGSFPQSDTEIAIDRMYADNNKIEPGDTIVLDGTDYTVSGLIALTDYSTMFENNSDTMFDSINFSVALVTDSCFEKLKDSRISYNYAWTYNDGTPADDETEKVRSDALSDDLVKAILKENGGSEFAVAMGILTLGNEIREFTPRYTNQAINFAIEDIGGDRNMMFVFLCIMIVIMAFIFGVTISHTLAKESAVIGTLRASGYTKAEVFRQYITMPVLITLLGALTGNISGYTFFKNLMTSAYYGSYSLTRYTTCWNAEAFVLTTVVPVLLMLVITSFTLIHKLRHTPLQFIRRDFDRKKKRKYIPLPESISFFNRFRLRIILQNISSYLTLFLGIFVAITLLLFGLMLSPLLDHVSESAVLSMPCSYQYMLKENVETSSKEAEKFAVHTMDTYKDGYNKESVTIYGVAKDSRYITCDLPERGVSISQGLAEKYVLSIGDTILLKEPFENKLLEFQVSGIHDGPTILNIYMSHKYFCEVFDEENDYYNGYFSNQELKDISENKIYSCITENDMTKLADQMTVSMGTTFGLFKIFSTLLFVLIVYLLTKIIIEKSSGCISLVKILGYKNSEIGKLYLIATSWMVVLSLLISFGLVTVLLNSIFVEMMKTFAGWIPLSISPVTYLEAFVLAMVCYGLVALLQMRKIQKLPMEEALKNVE